MKLMAKTDARAPRSFTWNEKKKKKSIRPIMYPYNEIRIFPPFLSSILVFLPPFRERRRDFYLASHARRSGKSDGFGNFSV